MHGLPLVWTLDLPEATPSNNTIKGLHFHAYKKVRKDWRGLVQGVMQMETGGPLVPLERCFISIERYSSGGGLDWDNAFGGLKPLLDCLVSPTLRNPDGLGLITDDNPRNIPVPFAFKQLPAKPGQGRTIVRIYDASTLQTDSNP
jgi:hypothetical protein